MKSFGGCRFNPNYRTSYYSLTLLLGHIFLLIMIGIFFSFELMKPVSTGLLYYNLTPVICLHTVFSIWPINRTRSGAITLGKCGSGIRGNEEVLHIPQISKAQASSSNGLISYPGTLVGCGVLLFCWDAVCVFCWNQCAKTELRLILKCYLQNVFTNHISNIVV